MDEEVKTENTVPPSSPKSKTASDTPEEVEMEEEKPLNGDASEKSSEKEEKLMNGDPVEETDKVNGEAEKEDKKEEDKEKKDEDKEEVVSEEEKMEVEEGKDDKEETKKDDDSADKDNKEKQEDDKEENKSEDSNKDEKKNEEESKDEKKEGESTDKSEESPAKPTKGKGSKKTPTTPQQPTRVSTRIKRTAKYTEEADIIDDDIIEDVSSSSAPSAKRRKSQMQPPQQDDDEIEITGEVVKNPSNGSDVEMIEESDPLAINESDVLRKNKEKKDAGVIIIDTHTLLRNQGNLQAAVAQSTNQKHALSGNQPVNLQSMQNAIHAITSNAAAAVTQQGLQNAYIAAIQQDDAYVIEAPSFIVPYVMEGKPKEPIKTFLERINKEQEDFENGKKDEDKKKEGDKEDKKEGEEKEDKEEEKDDKKEGEKKEDKDKEGEKKVDEEDKEKKEDKEEKKEEEVDKEDKDKETEVKKEEEKVENEDSKDDKEKTKKEDKETKDKDKEKETDKDKQEKEKEDDKEKEDGKEDKKEKEESKKDEAEVVEDKDSKKTDDDENKENKDVVNILDDKETKEKEDLSHLGKWEPFYRSSLGKFFLDLGLSQAQEFIQSDLLRMQKRRLDKMKTSPSYSEMANVKLLEKQLEQRKKQNSHLNVALKTCKFCNFKTESELVMNRHLESPHMFNYTYKCNFCEFETRGPQVILYHMEIEHCVRGRLERAPAFFQCPMCPFEDNNKSKMTRHSFSCAKKFKPEKNCDLADWEPPAKIPKVNRGRLNPVGSKYEPVKIQSLLPKGLAGMNLGQLPPSMVSSLVANANQLSAAGRGRGRYVGPVGSYKSASQMMAAARSLGGPTAAANLLYQSSRANTLFPQGKGTPQQPSISITPLPRGGASTQSKQAKDQVGKPSFVICEICDGYIKDLEQLRNHMNLIHKVKIHPKMIYNRPPLNCQKCQHRFFTDQGLERHLLGTHGLVTSSMQEAANKGKDAGRCPICGKVFQWKLLNHVSKDHKMTLKPAHLSYKCTVCTATFNMYRLFENHVYSAHSVVSKNKASESSTKKVNGSDSALKINDEITIIPQPASKSGKDLKIGQGSKATPNMSKEITITKVGTPPGPASSKKRNGGGGVEIISLDDSPIKTGQAKKRRETVTSKRARQSSPS